MKNKNLNLNPKILTLVAILTVILFSGIVSLSSTSAQSSTSDLNTIPLVIVPDGGSSESVNYYLKIDGISGESMDSGHTGELNLKSFHWGVSNPAMGGRTESFFDITYRLDKASPKLFLASVSGQHIKSMILTGRKAGGSQQDFLKITMTDVLITAYKSGTDPEGSIPTDQLSLNFAKIRYEYRPELPDGSLGEQVVSEWDLKRNK